MLYSEMIGACQVFLPTYVPNPYVPYVRCNKASRRRVKPKGERSVIVMCDECSSDAISMGGIDMTTPNTEEE